MAVTSLVITYPGTVRCVGLWATIALEYPSDAAPKGKKAPGVAKYEIWNRRLSEIGLQGSP